MTKTIAIGEQVLTVQEIYPYRYNYGEGKEVIRIKIARADHGYSTIEAALEEPAGDIQYMEDGETVNVYKGYTRDFKCSYQGGVYDVELTRVSALELKVEELESQIAVLAAN